MSRTNIKDLAQQRFIATPKLLLYGEKYKHLSGNAFKTYVALYDRFTLSVKNNWIDEDNNIYFVYDLKELEEITCIKENALRTARKQLKEVGLIEEVATGRNNRIYLSLPIPKDEEEAKFIITEQDSEDLKDTSKLTEEEKQKIAENLKGNQNSRKTDDTGKSSIAVEKPSSQHYDNYKKQTILENQVSETSKSSTNDTELSEPNKDFKDIKESYDEQNTNIEKSFNSKNPEQEESLIEQFITEEHLDELFGEEVIRAMKVYSYKNYDTFKVYVDKLVFAMRSVEKETNKDLFTINEFALHDELARTFRRVIKQYKAGKVKKDVNSYLFISLKSCFMDFYKFKNTDIGDIDPVPLLKYDD